MKRIALLVALFAGLSACTVFSDLEEGMNSRMGQPVSTLVGDLGYPSQTLNFAGKRLYVWNTGRSVNTLQQTTGFGGVPTLSVGPAVNYNCKITVEVDERDIMRDWSYEGNIGGCQSWANRLG